MRSLIHTAKLTPVLLLITLRAFGAIVAPYPSDPPVIVENAPARPVHVAAPVSAAALPLYSIGDPSADEQLYLELINRARANPAAEAARLRQITDPLVTGAYDFFNVDLNLLTSLLSSIPALPPLSMNAKLTAAARAHSLDMQQRGWQNHSGTDGSVPLTRVQAAGYSPSVVGENIYSYAETVAQGHAGFEVDWGDAGAVGVGGVLSIVGGMQTPAGHRANIHGSAYKEIGVGVLNTNKAATGPQLVTQDFGTEVGSKAFITGVAYYDLNQNQAYDVGEGIRGVLVEVSGAAFSAVTATAGGYSVPISSDGTYTVSFTFGGSAPVTRTVTVSGLANAKADLVLSYTPPSVSGPAAPGIGAPNAYQITPVLGATAYQWSSAQTAAAIAIGAEDALGSVTPAISSRYALVSTASKSAGTASYHLLNPEGSPQSFELKDTYLVGANAALSFASRLGGAASDQVAKVEVSNDGGTSWTTLFSQPGANSFGETAFSRKSVSLPQYAGQTVRFRFLLDFQQGGFADSLEPAYGWYIDDIQFSSMETLKGEVVNTVPTPAFSFVPASAAKQLLRARPIVSGEPFPYGPLLVVNPTTAVAAAVTKLKSLDLIAGGDVRLTFDVLSGSGSSFAIESAASVKGPWAAESSPQIQSSSATSFTAVVHGHGNRAQFYRVRSN